MAVYKVYLKTNHVNIVLFSLKLTERDASRRQMCGWVGGAICKTLSVNIHRRSSVATFAVALFAIARKLDLLRCSSADEWIKGMRHV